MLFHNERIEINQKIKMTPSRHNAIQPSGEFALDDSDRGMVRSPAPSIVLEINAVP